MNVNLSLATAFVDLQLKGATALVAGMDTVRNRISKSLLPLANEFGGLRNSVLNFVAAASPQAIRTFTGSMTLLSATIGTSFIPQVMQASAWIQKLSDYIRNMNPETKAQIASWVGYTVAVTGAVYAFTKLNAIFSLIVANPVASTFLAISAAILKVNSDMDKMIGKMNDAVDVMTRMKKGVYTEKEYKRSAAGAIETDGQLSDADKLNKAMEVRARLTKEVQAQSKEFYTRDALKTTGDYLLSKAGQTNHLDEARTSVQGKLKEAGMLDDLINRLNGKKGGPSFTAQSDIDKQKGRGIAMAGPGIGGIGGGGAVTLENAFMQNAQASLAADDISRKILQAQLANNNVAQQSNQHLERIADTTDRAHHP